MPASRPPLGSSSPSSRPNKAPPKSKQPSSYALPHPLPPTYIHLAFRRRLTFLTSWHPRSRSPQPPPPSINPIVLLLRLPLPPPHVLRLRERIRQRPTRIDLASRPRRGPRDTLRMGSGHHKIFDPPQPCKPHKQGLPDRERDGMGERGGRAQGGWRELCRRWRIGSVQSPFYTFCWA